MADIQNVNIVKKAESVDRTMEQTLNVISGQLDSILEMSQSAMKDAVGAESRKNYEERKAKKHQAARDNSSKTGSRSTDDDIRGSSKGSKSFSKLFDDMTDAIEDEFWKGLTGAPIKDSLKVSITNFADSLGVEVNSLGPEMGKILGNSLTDAFKGTSFGKSLSDKLTSFKSDLSGQLNNIINQAATNLQSTGKTDGFNLKDIMQGNPDMDMSSVIKSAKSNIVDFSSAVKDKGIKGAVEGLGNAAKGATSGASNLAPMLTNFGATLAKATPYALAAGAALLALEIATAEIGKRFKAMTESFSEFTSKLGNAADSYAEMEKINLKANIDRLTQDINSMIEASYDVMKQAAESMIDSWQQSLEIITSTQGYSKSDYQNLISNYAKRLQEEGLTAVVSVAEMTDNLKDVLNSGLSGSVAEEFAYIATVLTEAVPTEEWFSYAETYASIAANAIANGASQEEAIQSANEELTSFANNLLYASREISGGFTTSLKGASGLFESATEIVNAAKTGDATEVSGALTSVSALVGSIAPDLASGLVDAIVSAATGGNSETLTALRSLAGTGASNTSFLTALASNPKSVLTTMFSNLADLQSMSSDNFMEVAEGLSSIFGIDMDAFARVDFNYLAKAISEMNTSSDALADNIELLASGETTLTAEQLRNQQINEYMIEEGLSYVLDNEVARAVQEHLWDQELAAEMKEATYGVELVGSTQELLLSISQFVETIANILNPFYWASKVTNIIDSVNEKDALQADLARIIEAGKVGEGNTATFKALTSYTSDLSKAKNYAELLTGQSMYSVVSSNPASDYIDFIGHGAKITDAVSYLANAIGSSRTASSASSGVTSKYNWATVGKSVSSLLDSSAGYNTGSAYEALSTSASKTMSSNISSRLQDYINEMQTYVDNNQSYDEWAAAAGDYGIANLDDALSEAGLSAVDAEGYFADLEAQKISKYNYDSSELENQFYQDAITWYEEKWPLDEETALSYADSFTELYTTMIENQTLQLEELIASNKQLKEFYDQWIDYYVNHTAYTTETMSAYAVSGIKNAEAGETGDAVLALADALTSNAVDLKDPAVQTNVLLAQILIVAESIMQQTDSTTTVSLPTALSALGLGVTSTT